MTWLTILISVLQTLVYGLTVIGIPYVFTLIRGRIKNEQLEKILDAAEKVVIKSVEMTNQNFVDSLKKEGKFDEAAQKEAFEKTRNQVLAMLNEEAKATIIAMHGDLEAWIKMQIESGVVTVKIAAKA